MVLQLAAAGKYASAAGKYGPAAGEEKARFGQVATEATSSSPANYLRDQNPITEMVTAVAADHTVDQNM